MLAVVIPYFKRAFFAGTLAALAAQTDRRFKVFIGDDASPEDPADLISGQGQELDITYVRFPENVGATSLVTQWERCLELCPEAEWVMILGDDDVPGTGIVARFHEHLPHIRAAGSRVVRFATQKIDGEGKVTSGPYIPASTEAARDFLSHPGRSSLSEYVFRADALRANGFRDFPLAWFSDVLAVYETAFPGTIYGIGTETVGIRISGFSISGSRGLDRPKQQARFSYHHYLLDRYVERFSTEERRKFAGEMESAYLNDKTHLEQLARLSLLYVTRGWIVRLFRFYVKCITSVFRRLAPIR